MPSTVQVDRMIQEVVARLVKANPGFEGLTCAVFPDSGRRCLAVKLALYGRGIDVVITDHELSLVYDTVVFLEQKLQTALLALRDTPTASDFRKFFEDRAKEVSRLLLSRYPGTEVRYVSVGVVGYQSCEFTYRPSGYDWTFRGCVEVRNDTAAGEVAKIVGERIQEQWTSAVRAAVPVIPRLPDRCWMERERRPPKPKRASRSTSAGKRRYVFSK